jgi:PAS domain S-box-containing protein
VTVDPADAATHAPAPARDAGAFSAPLDGPVVRHSLDAIIVTDSSFVIRTWNPAAERIYGIAAADALGRRLREIVDAFDLAGNPFDPTEAEATLASSGSWQSRLVHRARIGVDPGRQVIVDSGVVLLRDGAGTTTGAIGINRDVTATARLETEIAALGSLVVATDRARTSGEVASAALEILCRGTGADAGLVTSMESTYEATASLGVSQATIDTILSYGQLGGPLARALEAPDAFVSADVATAPLREDVRAAVLGDGIAHLIVVGLRLSGRLTGLLSIGWRRAAPVQPSRAVMLQAAALIAASIENARLLAAVESGLGQERLLTRRMRALVELTQLPAASGADIEVSRLLAVLRGVLAADAGLYARIENDAFVLAAVDHPDLEAARPFIERPIDVFPVVAELRAGASAVLVPAEGEMTTPDGGAAVAARGFRTIAIFGLHEAEELVGAVFVGFSRPIDEVEVDERTLEAIGRIVDISFANRRLREVVGASERRYRDLFEHSPEALIVESREMRIVAANPAARRLFGDDLIGRDVRDLVVGDPVRLDLTRDDGLALRGSSIGRRLDGSTFPEEVELRRVEIAGEPHTLAMIRDLTDQVRMQAELVQAQKMEAIGLLVAGVAHELNNPLASIIAFSQLIRTDPALPDDLRTQSDLLVQEANRTRVIVQNLLDFARQRRPERVLTDLRPLVESVLGLQSYVLARNQVAVDVAIPDDLPPLLVDRSQLQQVLVNVTFNSAQAMRDGGRPGRIAVEASAVGDDGSRRVRIAIIDNGPGVAPEIVDRLFMPFTTTKAPGEGTGLGLSVSFGIVAAHGGSLRHEPTPGGGATFVIELPIEAGSAVAEPPPPAPDVAPTAPVPGPPPSPASSRPDDPSPSPSPPHPSSPSAPSRAPATSLKDHARVLVLDDEPSIREFLARVLVRNGYQPVLAGTGAEALEIVRTAPPAAILCDHRMAGMSGTEFHDQVGRIAPDLARRFAFMSGDVLNPELREFAETRGVLLLAKPFDVNVIDGLVARLLTGTPADA